METITTEQGLQVADAGKKITVPFHGTELCVVEHDAQPYTPMKPIITGMGLTWHGQHAKIKANTGRWGVLELRIPSPGGLQSMLCMPLRKLPGWLSGIESGKVKSPEARAAVVQYQEECDDVLWKYWNDGTALNPRTAFTVNPGDVLTAEEAETLRLMLTSAADRLPKDQQAALMLQGWSRLKAHFKVGYREIPRHEFSEAVSILARHTAAFAVNGELEFTEKSSQVDAKSVAGIWVRKAEADLACLVNIAWEDQEWDSKDDDVRSTVELVLWRIQKMVNEPYEGCHEFSLEWWKAHSALRIASKSLARKDSFFAKSLERAVEMFEPAAGLLEYVEHDLK